MSPDALRAIADAADRHHAVIQPPRVNDHGVTVACLWSSLGPDGRVIGFAAATWDGAVAIGGDVVDVATRAAAMAPSLARRH